MCSSAMVPDFTDKERLLDGVAAAVVGQLNHAEDLHQCEGGVVRGHPGEVVLQHGQGAGQSHVATAAEQSHA